MRNKLVAALFLAAALCLVPGAQAKVKDKPHKIVATGRPFVAIGHAVKKTAVTAATFSWTAFDAAVVDPFGVALQAFADGVDMAIVMPLEALPPPISYVGEGLGYVYQGLDKAGQVLAR